MKNESIAYIGEVLPGQRRYPSEEYSQEKAQGNEDFNDSVDSKWASQSKHAGEGIGQAPAHDRPRTEATDECAEHQDEREIARSETVDENTEPRYLVSETDESGKAVQKKDRIRWTGAMLV